MDLELTVSKFKTIDELENLVKRQKHEINALKAQIKTNSI